jgi:hypothetical protein
MSQRHPSNRNLTLFHGNEWHGLSVYTERGPQIENYLERAYRVLQDAVEEYPRSSMIRCEPRVPKGRGQPDSAVISRFIASLQAQLDADADRKCKEGKRVHPCKLRHIWVREQDSAIHDHYHVALLLNRDAYFSLGDLRSRSPESGRGNQPESEVTRNMADRIRKAWASALGLRPEQTAGLVHFSDNPVHRIDANSPDFFEQFASAFYRVTYLTKADTKHYGNGLNSFGCSYPRVRRRRA